ncbi:MAG: glycine--tRNA ligase [Bacilli bacterium]|nr:glycine--tRNA ligase [Bacilli bacterium]
MSNYKFSEIVNHLVVSGFVFPSSQIYGGLANVWDYGPLGAELKKNIKQIWHREFIQKIPCNVLIDTAIFMNKKVWQATGHVNAFNDPMVECKNCKSRYRADYLIKKNFNNENVNNMSFDEINNFLKNNNIKCENCSKINNFTDVKKFNMMFAVDFATTRSSNENIFLRPETAQGVFVNFKNVYRSMRKKIPFGICNHGKSFRNEITLGNFIFRTKEFEQLETEFFCEPGTDDQWFAYWKQKCFDFINLLGIKKEKVRFRDHEKSELSFYSKETVDIEYNFPSIGWSEILGIANRTDYDLKRHSEYSKENLKYNDLNNSYFPYCIEPSIGLDRLMLTILVDGFDKENVNGDERIVMHINPLLSPYKVVVLPLSKDLSKIAREIFDELSKKIMCIYDESGSIGKRYRRADAIGVPFAITIDNETISDDKVTVRDRDTMKQKRILKTEIYNFIANILKNY